MAYLNAILWIAFGDLLYWKKGLFVMQPILPGVNELGEITNNVSGE